MLPIPENRAKTCQICFNKNPSGSCAISSKLSISRITRPLPPQRERRVIALERIDDTPCVRGLGMVSEGLGGLEELEGIDVARAVAQEDGFGPGEIHDRGRRWGQDAAVDDHIDLVAQ